MGVIGEHPVVLQLVWPTAAWLEDERFFELCLANRDLRIERDAEGRMIVTSPTGFDSARQNAALTFQLERWSKRDGMGIVTDSSGTFILPNGATRSADAAWMQKGRVAALSPGERKRFPRLVPDFVIELRSESDNLSMLMEKMRENRANGVSLGWLVDPQSRTVWTFRAGESEAEVTNANQVSADPVLPGFVLDLSQVW